MARDKFDKGGDDEIVTELKPVNKLNQTGFMEVLQTTTMQMNRNSPTIQGQYPFLQGQPYNLAFQTDKISLFMTISFNYGNQYLQYTISDSSGRLLQGDTTLVEFPTNLLLNYLANEYFIFYNRCYDEKIEFGRFKDYEEPIERSNFKLTDSKLSFDNTKTEGSKKWYNMIKGNQVDYYTFLKDLRTI